VGQILFASKEAQECSALKRDLVANGAAQHGVAGFEDVEDGTLRDWAVDFQLYFAADLRQRSEMLREDDADHERLINLIETDSELLVADR